MSIFLITHFVKKSFICTKFPWKQFHSHLENEDYYWNIVIQFSGFLQF